MEEEVARRVEALVAKRVEEELEKRKDEIEAEVMRRVEEAKKIMEKQMLEELERKRREELEEQKKKEVKFNTIILCKSSLLSMMLGTSLECLIKLYCLMKLNFLFLISLQAAEVYELLISPRCHAHIYYICVPCIFNQ